MFFDGTANGLPATTDVVAFSLAGPTLYLSLERHGPARSGAGGTAGLGDVYQWNGASSFTRVVDASTVGRCSNAAIDALELDTAAHFWVSYPATTTTIGSRTRPGRGRRGVRRRHLVGLVRRHRRRADHRCARPGRVQPAHRGRPDACPARPRTSCSSPPPGTPPRRAPAGPRTTPTSTAGTAPPTPGSSTRAWRGFLPGANVDGAGPGRRHALLRVLRREHVTLPGIGTVQDEDVVFHDAAPGRCSSTGHRRTGWPRAVRTSTPSASPVRRCTSRPSAAVNPPGRERHARDDADVYSWDGTIVRQGVRRHGQRDPRLRQRRRPASWTRCHSPPPVVRQLAPPRLPGIGTVQDEDVVQQRTRGHVVGLLRRHRPWPRQQPTDLDVDAFDVP